MQKAQILNIQRYCVHDGPGIRTTVFFKGCPLSCVWCSNPTTQNKDVDIILEETKCLYCGTCANICPENAITFAQGCIPIIDRSKCTLCQKCLASCSGLGIAFLGKEYTVEQLFKEIERDSLIYRNSGGGVTLSGGEILMQADFCIELLSLCQNTGFHTAIETSSQGSYEKLQAIAKSCDYIMADIKHMDPQIHKEVTGISNELIITNLEKLTCEFANVHIRIPVIPTINTDDTHIIDLAHFVNDLSCCDVELLPYHPFGATKYKSLGQEYTLPLERISEEQMTNILKLFRQHAPKKEILCTI